MKKSKISEKTTRIPSPFAIIPQKTEWTVNAKIAEWINQIVKDKNLSLGLAEVETTIEGDRKRPDIILYERPNSQNILCCFEFKQPYFDPFSEEELKEPARKKATKRQSPYFVVSNYQKLIWYNTEKVNKVLSDEQQIYHIYDLSNIENIDLIERPEYKRPIISNLKQFLRDLVEVYTGKIPEPLLTIDELLIFLLHSKVERLHFYYRGIVYDQFHKDKKFALQLRQWFTNQNWSFFAQEEDFIKVARQTAYLLVNKIIFYYALRSKRGELDPLEIPESLTKGGILQTHLQGYFNYVCENVDYETIYNTDFIDDIAFPDNREIVEEIKNLLKMLDRFDFSTLKLDIIGRIFERLIPDKERHNLGQYFTDPDVVDLILQFCLKNEKDKVIDPACGSGTFLVRAYQRKKIMNQMLPHEEILKALWGIDIAKFPAHLATINLAICDLDSEENYPHIIAQDFFSLLPNTVEFKIPRKVKIKGLSGKEKVIEHPRYFDCVVGNPPYTRQEEIPKIAGKEGKYKENLIEKSLIDINGKSLATISKRAGIHTYFFVHGTKFLHNKGQFGFIVSNSWLDVDYGKGLQEFFLKNYKIVTIIESKVERWFEDADINTCIVILEKCAGDSNKKERDKNLVHFVYLFKSFRHFIPPVERLWERKVERKDKIDALIKTILGHSQFYQNEDLCISPKSQKELWNEGFDKKKNKYVGSKWGKYIRAPKIFFTILEKGKDKLVPLNEIADVRRGFTTGANEFFYLTEKEIKKRKIEKEFWMHKDDKGNWVPNYVIWSGRESKSIVVNPECLKFLVLLIHQEKTELKGTKILRYIKEGERKGFHKRPTCSSRKRWYDLGERKFGNFFYFYQMGERFLVLDNKYRIYTDCNLFDIYIKDKIEVKTIGGLLNTTLFRLLLEIQGRQLIGALTVLKIQVYELLQNLIVDPRAVSQNTKIKIMEEFNNLTKRNIGSIFSELGASLPEEVNLDKVKPDRRELDKIVMREILGLTDEEQLEVYRAVVDLVRSRIIKAKSVKLRKGIKRGLDIDLFIKDVMQEVGEETLGKFYKEKILSQKPLLTKDLSPFIDREVKVEKEIFGWKLSSKKEYLECSTEEEARYLKIWVDAGVEKIKVPKDKNYLKEILPQLELLKQRIDDKISIYLDSIFDQKFRSQIQHQLWQKIV